ncbi:glutamate--cysteine ligase 2 [Wenjunlia tyrosinilytica]|uniref:Putative glutamate--cysteine ligase 2 n=1 Tax=Wenjunlia tyrosinilytica TaxID=1544741 RepID=A0A917ZRB0_9ACTN|nr:glutamate--cysteine ligase [Wenjunlia tyrosinilytica]GGO90830.1 putative glutamate--cysteine ligase 2 [Wenjunlia tyrosinilytica]
MTNSHARTVGVEEELLIVDPVGGVPRAFAEAMLSAAPAMDTAGGQALEAELQREQLETGTRPCASMADVAREVRRWRRDASGRARQAGAEVAALATSPLPVDPSLTPKPRYRRMLEAFGLLAHEQLSCGCHVHVEVESDKEGVAVLDRMRPWLAPLLALSANSPFWQGEDTCYASYRSLVWSRWPSAGPTELFGSPEGYRSMIRTMLDSATLLDEGMVYFDARMSRKYPTVEIRIADVCLDADDTVLVAALVRGLVETSARAWRAGEAPDQVPTHLLRLASWRAARSGLAGELVHPLSRRPAPAAVVLRALADHVGPALKESGDLDLVEHQLQRVLERGNGAHAQREAIRRGGSLRDVVAEAVARTLA